MTLGAKYGNRKLKIVAANIDDIRNSNILYELDVRTKHILVEIVCIQETQYEIHRNTSAQLSGGI